MIIQTIGTGTDQDPYRADESQIPEEIRQYVERIEQISETQWQVTFSEKYELNLIKEENKALKAEIKLQRDRMAEAKDFKDFKTKIKKVKDSEEKPTKWRHKIDLLEGEKIEHKGIQYISLRDHTADKGAEPPNKLYRRQQ